jgi:hypothetical protein
MGARSFLCPRGGRGLPGTLTDILIVMAGDHYAVLLCAEEDGAMDRGNSARRVRKARRGEGRRRGD